MSLRAVEVDNQTAKFDLLLSMQEESEGYLRGTLEYNTDLFDAGTISRLAGHYEVMLAGIAANPRQRIEELPLLNGGRAGERRLGNGTGLRRSYREEVCLGTLFEEQVERTPAAVAVEYGGAKLSYAELNGRSNQLARHLRELGVGAETLVGICVERSLEMVVGLLAVLKAGGAYVPLDPGYPRQRLAYVLADAEVEVLLTQSELRAQLPVEGLAVVCVDSDWERIANLSPASLAPVTTAANLAYVIYTSGSTGQPKGVQITHRALINFSHFDAAGAGLTAADTLLSVTTLSFDIAGLEVYCR